MVDWLKHIISEFFYSYPRYLDFTTLQKFADRINNVMLGKIISSFVALTGTRRHIFRIEIETLQWVLSQVDRSKQE